MSRPATISQFNIVPRGHPTRRAAAQRIRAIRAIAFGEAHEAQRRAAALHVYRESVWTKQNAVGCVETGRLFHSAWEAAAKRGIGKYNNNQVLQSCRDGRFVCGLRFVFLNRPRWQGLTVWESPDAVGCVETGELFFSPGHASAVKRIGVNGITWSISTGSKLRFKRISFVWLHREIRAKYARKAATIWRKKETHENQCQAAA